jgi:hypothetical protein
MAGAGVNAEKRDSRNILASTAAFFKLMQKAIGVFCTPAN